VRKTHEDYFPNSLNNGMVKNDQENEGHLSGKKYCIYSALETICTTQEHNNIYQAILPT
jgi:hypothetical protein